MKTTNVPKAISKLLLFLTLSLYLGEGSLIAQELSKIKATGTISGEGEHSWHPNHLSLFAGYTTDLDKKDGYKIGIEYERRLSDHFGLGVTFDFTGKDFEIYALSVGATAYPFKDLPMVLGAGVGAKFYSKQTKPFIRTLIAYDFHVNSISISPTIFYDIYERENLLSPGICLGIGF